MLYLIIIILLVIPIATIAGLIYAYKKLHRSYFLLLIFTITVIPFGAFKIFERNAMLEVIPDSLGVNSISYSKEESWGFGPGGNEAGIRTYPLSEEVVVEISQRGMEFFKNLPPNKNQQDRGWRGIYEHWSETPIKLDNHWKPNPDTGSFEIYDYICAYGFCINIKSEIVKEANFIVNSAGSYYAYGRIGLIIVCPSKKLVIYIYNG